jgi:hypothetical protein
MERLQFSDVRERYLSLRHSEKRPILTDSMVIERMKAQFEEFQATAFEDGVWMISRKAVNVRRTILKACAEVGITERLLEVSASVAYVRNQVSAFNRREGRSVRVRSQGGSVWLYEDIETRETLTVEEFEAYKDDMLAKIERARAKVVGEVEPVDEASDDVFEDELPTVQVAQIVTNCLECGDEMICTPNDIKVCDMCKGID